MTTKTSALEILARQGFKLIFSFKGFEFYRKGDERALYDVEKRDIIPYNINDNICEYINKWREIKQRELREQNERM